MGCSSSQEEIANLQQKQNQVVKEMLKNQQIIEQIVEQKQQLKQTKTIKYQEVLKNLETINNNLKATKQKITEEPSFTNLKLESNDQKFLESIDSLQIIFNPNKIEHSQVQPQIGQLKAGESFKNRQSIKEEEEETLEQRVIRTTQEIYLEIDNLRNSK